MSRKSKHKRKCRKRLEYLIASKAIKRMFGNDRLNEYEWEVMFESWRKQLYA